MIEAIADRLAEAFAEKLHEIVRKEVWAYAPEENLSADDLLKVKYQGKPSCCLPKVLLKRGILETEKTICLESACMGRLMLQLKSRSEAAASSS